MRHNRHVPFAFAHRATAAGPADFAWSAIIPWLAVMLLSAVGCGQPREGAADNQASAAPPTRESSANEPAAEDNPFPRRLPAPSLDGGSEWINVTKPLSLADLRGKFVLLDFWTYCCINCMHVLPEIKRLERAYPNELVVVGVHSAKFEGEQESDNIREAVMRYEIEHPVVNDPQMTIWQRWGARSWPTLVLIDPVGDVVWFGQGEKTFEDLRAPLERGLPYYRKHGLLSATLVPALQGVRREADTPLRFPGKVLADAAGGRLFVADSNHNRIVVADLDGGRLRHLIGGGAIGHADGPFDKCSFHHPQGMALVGERLYVADTENHLLRRVDLAAEQVTTVAGTGVQGSMLASGTIRRQPKSTPLNSPWALWAHDGVLYIAMAGPHQIWRMPLDESRIELHAGDGREDIVDGPLASAMFGLRGASFAQPSGLASDGTRLFVADSEGSAIRSVPLDAEGSVETLVGQTGTLFDFGDVDGVGAAARLQHPLGVAFHQGKLYVADTYNNKIKVIDVANRSCRTLAGSGRPGNKNADDGKDATFNEPAGITAAGNRLYVADTNNHAIRVVELGDRNRVSTLVIDELPAQ